MTRLFRTPSASHLMGNWIINSFFFAQDIISIYYERVNLTVNRQGRDTNILLPKGFLSNLSKNQRSAFLYPRYPVIIEKDEDVKYVEGKMQAGDRIVGINGTPLQYMDEYLDLKKDLKNTVIQLNLIRGADRVDVKVKTLENSATGLTTRDPLKILGTDKKEYSFF